MRYRGFFWSQNAYLICIESPMHTHTSNLLDPEGRDKCSVHRLSNIWLSFDFRNAVMVMMMFPFSVYTKRVMRCCCVCSAICTMRCFGGFNVAMVVSNYIPNMRLIIYIYIYLAKKIQHRISSIDSQTRYMHADGVAVIYALLLRVVYIWAINAWTALAKFAHDSLDTD